MRKDLDIMQKLYNLWLNNGNLFIFSVYLICSVCNCSDGCFRSHMIYIKVPFSFQLEKNHAEFIDIIYN